MNENAQEHSVVATYDSHQGAEAAVRELQRAGLDMKRLSIIGKDFHTEEHALGFYTAGDRIKFWGGRGAFWGTLGGLLFGSAFFFIPAIGPLVVMGPLVGWIVGALEGAAVGGAAGVLGAALVSLGIPSDIVVKYELEVKAGKYLVLARGTDDIIKHARAMLETTGASLLTAHAAHAELQTKNFALAQHAIRQRILELLSDEEIARVSTSETAGCLSQGDEYLDLEQLDQGVQRARGPKATGQLLPRGVVHNVTWQKILSELPLPPSLTMRAGG